MKLVFKFSQEVFQKVPSEYFQHKNQRSKLLINQYSFIFIMLIFAHRHIGVLFTKPPSTDTDCHISKVKVWNDVFYNRMGKYFVSESGWKQVGDC